ncbi:MAG: ribbon-helix-helix protein, CopG family [Pseudomonadota bacterium]
MAVTSIRLQPDIEKHLQDAVKRLSRSKNWLINQAIKEYLEREAQELQRWQETLEALDSANQGKVVDGDTVEQWLQSWGTDDELPPPKP